MNNMSATLDAHAVQAAGGSVLGTGAGVQIGGWIIQSTSSSISADVEMDRLKEQLNVVAVPEQFFGSNLLRLSHKASGIELHFDAMGALRGWMEDGSADVQVGEAAQWQRSRQKDLRDTGAKTLQYDWTFTTGYRGAIRQAQAAASGGPSSSACCGAEGPTAQAQPLEHSAAPVVEEGGGTAARGPVASVGCVLSEEGVEGGDENAPTRGRLPSWEPTLDQMNRGLLMSRDPILFYAELPLYESELEDHGASQVSVKVRVMPRCWYVLLRFWLRVDHVLVRLRETRLFCQFDAPQTSRVVLREVRHCEGSFQELRDGGAPPEGPAYADADSTSAALMAVAPVGVKLYCQEKLQL